LIHIALAHGYLFEVDLIIGIVADDGLRDEQLEPAVVPRVVAPLLVIETQIKYPLHRLEEGYRQCKLRPLCQLRWRSRLLARFGQAAHVRNVPPAAAYGVADGSGK